MIYLLVCSISAYFLGSINAAVILSKKVYKTDIRKHGSKNAGATNMLRTFGKKSAAAVFVFDFLKGIIAVTVARSFVAFFDAPYECILLAGFFVQLGHIFPIYFKFRGGKGVATAAGAALTVMPVVALILLLLFVLIVLLTKIVSLASALCAVIYPLLAFFLCDNNAEYNFIFAASCAVMIAVKHASNIGRLLDRNESKTFMD